MVLIFIYLFFFVHRELLFITNSQRILETNLNCRVKVDVKSDRSEPVFDVTFSKLRTKLKFYKHLQKYGYLISHNPARQKWH